MAAMCRGIYQSSMCSYGNMYQTLKDNHTVLIILLTPVIGLELADELPLMLLKLELRKLSTDERGERHAE